MSTSRRRKCERSPTAASAWAATRCWSSSGARGDADFRYRIFNADGGEVEQCGNGARCFVMFVRDQGLTDKREIRVETAGGVIVPRLEDDGQVTVDMGVPRFAPGDVPFVGGIGARGGIARRRRNGRAGLGAVDGQPACRAGRRRRRRRAGDHAGPAHRAPCALSAAGQRGLHAGRRSRYHSPARMGARRGRDARLRHRRLRRGGRGIRRGLRRFAGARGDARRRTRRLRGRARGSR